MALAFVDECSLFVESGRGGDGSASLHSEPYKPRGGPDGGDGGPGGSVVLEVSPDVRDLKRLADHPHQKASPGSPGRSSRRHGAAGKDLVVAVPDGTVVHDDQGLLADLVGPGARAIVARGGRGGRGNARLATSRNRVPRVAEHGEDGEQVRLRVELRTVADVGLVGLPNAGKSTLLGVLSAAKPKIADYPFTTLTPNLGVTGGDGDRFVIADVPGLIEGAAGGRGLGHRFLRHVMRCRALVLVVDLSAASPGDDLRVLRDELAAYDPELPAKLSLVVGAKADLVEDPLSAVASLDGAGLAVSALRGDGVADLGGTIASLAAEAAANEGERQPHVVLRPGRPRFTVSRSDDGTFHVRGRTVERWVTETDLDDEEQVAVLQSRLKKEGVDRRLAALGARLGDDVEIGGRVFDYVPGDADRASGPGTRA